MKAVLRIIKNNPFFETLLHSKNYFISNIAVKGITIISLPVMTRLLLPSDYGIINVFNSYNSILVSVLTLNCYVALGRYYYEGQDDLREFFGTSIILVLSLLSLSFILFLIFRDELSSLLSLPSNVILFFVPSVMFYVFASWYEQIYVPQRKSRQIAIRNVISSYGGFALIVALTVLLSEDKYLGTIYALTITGAIFAFYYFYVLGPYIKFSFSIKALKYMLAYSLPLLPYTIGSVILSQIDRIIINKYCGQTDVGLYSFAFNIGILLTLVLSSIHLAWMPAYYKLMEEQNYSQLNIDITLIMKTLMICAFFLVLFGKEIGMLLAKSNFHSSLFIIPVVVIGLIVYSYSTFYSWHIQFAKKNIYMTPILLTSAFTSILLNMVFVPIYGYVAAPFVSCISYLVMLITAIIVTKKILKLYTTPILQVSKPFFMMIPFIIVYYGLTSLNLSTAINVSMKMCLFIIFSSIIFFDYLTRFYSTITDQRTR